MSLSWKPVRKKGIYCSPACGFDCTLAGYKAAWAKGRAAKKLLKNPKGWTIHVWENGGWHVTLRKGGMNLSIRSDWSDEPTENLTFSVLFSADGDCSGESFWSHHFTSKDPNKVIEHQLKLAKKFISKCQKAVDKVAA